MVKSKSSIVGGNETRDDESERALASGVARAGDGAGSRPWIREYDIKPPRYLYKRARPPISDVNPLSPFLI